MWFSLFFLSFFFFFTHSFIFLFPSGHSSSLEPLKPTMLRPILARLTH